MPRPHGARLAALVALAVLGCGRDRRPDVLLVVLDTVRADHLSTYGYARPTAPALDALAAEAVVHRRAVASGTWTPPSHASLFTGLMPSEHGVRYATGVPGEGVYALAPAVPTLAERLRAAGYRTAAFAGNHGFLDPVFGLARGFDEYRRDGLEHAGPLVDAAVAWLRHRRGRQPLFLFLNAMDAHAPYAPPPPYDAMFPATLPPGVPPTSDPAKAAERMARYDGAIRYETDALARLFAAVRALGRWDDALVVVTADHGDLFGERGRWEHTGDPVWSLVHVPLLVKYPHGARRGVEERPVGLADVAPTILATLGLPPLPVARAPLWAPRGPAVAENVGPAGVTRAAYDEAGHALVETVGAQGRTRALFDLATDPAEERPRDPEGDPAGAQLAAELDAAVRALAAARPGPVVFPRADRKLAERLRSLGYLR
ncbi:MAG TPA: sulfatase [Candidatus Binatia bacterium]|nr:sulfatase [Candidatus Binatia bacterium]